MRMLQTHASCDIFGHRFDFVGFSLSKTAVIFPKNTVEFLFNGGSIIFIRVTLAEVQGERVIITNFCQVQHMACVAGVKRERGRGNLGARGRKERNSLRSKRFLARFV